MRARRFSAAAVSAGRGRLVAAMVVDSVGTGLFLPFTVLYFLHTTSLSARDVGLALTAAGLIALPTPVAVAAAIDRLPVQFVVAAGNLISALAFVGYVFVQTSGELFAAALAAQIGQATFWTATRALVGQVTRPDERRPWFALQTATRNAGYGLGGLAGALAVSAGSAAAFRALAIVDAISYAVAAALLLSWRAPPPAATEPVEAVAPPMSYRRALADVRLLTVTAINAAFVLCAAVLTVLMSVYVVTELHRPAWLAGLLFTVNTALVLLAQTPVTARTRQRGATAMLRLSALGLALSFTVLWALAAASGGIAVVGLFVAVVIFTVAGILEGPTINALVVELAPAHAPGRHLAIFQLSWGVGQAIAPALLLSLLSAGVGWLWATLLAICLGVVLIAPGAATRPRGCAARDSNPEPAD